MKEKSRRQFLAELGISIGAFAIGKNIAKALPLKTIVQQQGKPTPMITPKIPKEFVDFRYAPSFWQSTYCYPDDPYKSLVGKNGELLYGHEGQGADENDFPHVASVSIKGAGDGKFVEQKLETPGIPIITTKREWDAVSLTLVSYASSHEDEGRVDNLLIEVRPKGAPEVKCTPQIIVTSKSIFWSNDRKQGEVHFDDHDGKLFMAANSRLQSTGVAPMYGFELEPGTATEEKPLRYFIRFPQAGQSFGKIEDRLDKHDELIAEVRTFWQQWKSYEGNVQWNVPSSYGNFYTACVRNMVQAREIKEKKKVFQVGPTVYRGLWIIDGNFLLEAARYAGYDKEAQEGLETIWELQDANGAFFAGAGKAHWKDTAAAVYTLCRQAELSQNWEYFNSLYPDAVKAMKYLNDLREKGKNDGTPNGKYGLLPQGFGDSGIGSIRPEFTNTIWTLIALKMLLETAYRFLLQRRSEINDFYTELRVAFFAAAKQEMRKHPKGFTYLPMLMKDDPTWNDPDEEKRPQPQAAQIYLSHAIYPGQLFIKDFNIVDGHIDLMKAVTSEDIPIETGWLPHNGVWAYNAGPVAQVYLWKGMQELARKTFIGFLNHASPLYAWREEQPLLGSSLTKFIGDMPHNWASAECIRYLRHMMIMEDEDTLRLLDGIGIEDLALQAPMSITYSPTRWGRVSISLEPLDVKAWSVKFKREDFNAAQMPELKKIEMPRHLPGNFHFDKITSVEKFYKNGPRVVIEDIKSLEWQATYRNFRKK